MIKLSAISASMSDIGLSCKKQFAQPQSPQQNCRRSFGIKTKVLLIQGMGHGVA
jgi:hypothetical protein